VQKQANFRKRYLSFTMGTTVAAVLSFAVISACTQEQAKAKPNIVHKDAAPAPGVVAKVDGQNISEDDLIGDGKFDFYELKKREYDLKMERLNKLLQDRLIGAEAKTASMSTEDYINKKIVGGGVKISDGDVKKFIAEKHIPDSQVNPQIKERIISYLQQLKRQDAIEAHVAKLTKNNPVEVYFNKPKMDVQVDAGNAPILGGTDAKVQVIEFSDFQCPYCARGAEVVHELKAKYGNKIKIAFKQFPLPMHHDARPSAEAALCVNEQGTAKFWKFHDLAFKAQDKLDSAGLAKLAKEAGADEKKFSECLTGKKFSSAVDEDMKYGEKIGVRSTPTFFVNGQLIAGAVPIEQFSEIIDDELANKK